MAGSVLCTDEATTYDRLGREFIQHAAVNHAAGEYVGAVGQSTKKLENYFPRLRRSIDDPSPHQRGALALLSHGARFPALHLQDQRRPGWPDPWGRWRGGG